MAFSRHHVIGQKGHRVVKSRAREVKIWGKYSRHFRTTYKLGRVGEEDCRSIFCSFLPFFNLPFNVNSPSKGQPLQKWVSGCNLNSDLPAIKNISIVLYSILLSSRASVNCLSDPDSLLQHGEYICVCSILAFTGPNNDCITKIH